MYFKNARHKELFRSFYKKAVLDSDSPEKCFIASLYILSSLAEDHPIVGKSIKQGSINFNLLRKINSESAYALVQLARDLLNPYYWPCASFFHILKSQDTDNNRIAISAIRYRFLF
ncbi:MAG: hypothetical protein U9N81_03810 [Bacillota bacterium]|nr:hypothetical protein [Bacillota bacterium]